MDVVRSSRTSGYLLCHAEEIRARNFKPVPLRPDPKSTPAMAPIGALDSWTGDLLAGPLPKTRMNAVFAFGGRCKVLLALNVTGGTEYESVPAVDRSSAG